MLFFSAYNVVAQLPPSPVLKSLESSFEEYAFSKRPADLFLHVDKQVYTPNENIWFTAYLLNSDTASAMPRVLYCMLVREPAKKIVLSERFIVNGSFSGGAIFLPDSLREGEYRLIAYVKSESDRGHKSVFQQSLTIKTPDGPLFKWSYYPVEEMVGTDSVHFKYKITTAYGGVAAGARVSYALLADGEVVAKKQQVINPFGELILAVSREKVLGKCVELQATITRQQEMEQVNLVIPLLREEIKIRHFAEGGNLVHGQPSYLGIEMKNAQGMPIAAKASLVENDRAVAAFITDQYGMGVVKWTFDKRKHYAFQLEDSSRKVLTDSFDIKPESYSLHVPQGVVADSSLEVEIGVPAGQDTCHLIIHNYREVFFSGTLLVQDQRAVLRLPAALLRPGVATITLFNAAGQPQAERAVYKPGYDSLNVQFSTDSAIYHHRSRIRLNVKITDHRGRPVQAIFSLACVLANRIVQGRMVDITRFWNFDRYMTDIGNLPAISFLQDRGNIDRLLLTKYWTRYNWEKIHLSNKNVLVKEKNCDTGKVYVKNKQANKPIPMVVVGGVTPFVFETDYQGNFELPSNAMLAAPGQKVVVMPVTRNKAYNFRVEVYNGCSMADSVLAAVRFPEANEQAAEWTVQEQQLMKMSLKPVIVTAARQQEEAAFVGATGSIFSCKSDWVCMNNILNCQNHPVGSPPVNGRRYYYVPEQRMVTYKCELVKEEIGEFVKELNGINYPKEFYVADYTKYNPSMPEIMSTVFWSYQVATGEKGEASLEFFTNDLSGTFHCILQGMSTQGPVSGKSSFKVVQNNPLPSNIPPGSINMRE